MRRLPFAERAFVFFVLAVNFLLPSCSLCLRLESASSIGRVLDHHPFLPSALGLALVVPALLVLEPPHSLSPRRYLQQLRLRWARISAVLQSPPTE